MDSWALGPMNSWAQGPMDSCRMMGPWAHRLIGPWAHGPNGALDLGPGPFVWPIILMGRDDYMAMSGCNPVLCYSMLYGVWLGDFIHIGQKGVNIKPMAKMRPMGK